MFKPFSACPSPAIPGRRTIDGGMPLLAAVGLALLAGCASPNVKKPGDYAAAPAPAVHDKYYDPYAAYGSSNATWAPPAVDRWGTIVKPNDPSTDWTRPDYEAAPWATGAQPSPYGGPAGTF